MKIKKFYGVLFHNEKELIKKSSKEFLKFVELLKENNITKRVGVSVYSLKSLNSIIKKFDLDLIQIPGNVFDKRFLNKELLDLLKKKRIKIFLRSVFLKGVLINKRNRIKKLENYNHNFEAFDNWLIKEKISNNKFFCIDFILSKKINNLVIGFDDFNEYKEVSSFKKENYVAPPNFVKNQSDRNRLLRPDFW